MKIKYNGEYADFSCSDISLEALAGLKIADKEGVIAIVNQHYIRQEEWITCLLSDGDQVEFLTIAGGG